MNSAGGGSGRNRRGQRGAVFALLLAALAACGAAATDSLSERRLHIEQMNADEREQLWRKYERFRALPPAEQARLRSLNAELLQDPGAARLQQLIKHYQQWLDGLSAADRAELISMEPPQRLQRIVQLRSEERRRLGPADAQAFAAWLEARVMRRFPERRADFQRLSEVERRERMRGMLQQSLANPKPRQAAAGGPGGRRWEAFTPEDFEELRESLSAKARAEFDQADLPADRRQLLLSWIKQVYARGPGGIGPKAPLIGEERLRRFFYEELTPSERVGLLRLPAEQMQRQLRRMYQNRHPAPKDNRKAGASSAKGADR